MRRPAIGGSGSVTAPLTKSGNIISIPAATQSAAGYMAAQDKDQLFACMKVIANTNDLLAIADVTTAGAGGGTNTLASGASTGGGAVAGRLGVIQCAVTTNVTPDRAGFWAAPWRGTAYMGALGNGAVRFALMFKIDQLSNATDEFQAYFGIGDTTASEPTNGLYLMYDRAGTGTAWTFKSAASSSRSTATGGSFPTVDTNWHILEIQIDAGYTTVQGFLDGVSLGTVTTNLPTAVNFFPGFFGIRKTAGASGTVTMRCDLSAFVFTPTTTRGY